MNRKSKHEEKHKGEGSVWTTCSDLFMTLAAVFLILFVMSMINAGVTRLNVAIERKSHEDLLKGMISPKEKAQNEKDMKEVQDDIKEIEDKRKAIQSNLRELAELNESLEQRKDTLNRLFKENMEKTGRLTISDKKIREKEFGLYRC